MMLFNFDLLLSTKSFSKKEEITILTYKYRHLITISSQNLYKKIISYKLIIIRN